MFLKNWERGEHVFVLGNWEEKTTKMGLKKDHAPSPYLPSVIFSQPLLGKQIYLSAIQKLLIV